MNHWGFLELKLRIKYAILFEILAWWIGMLFIRVAQWKRDGLHIKLNWYLGSNLMIFEDNSIYTEIIRRSWYYIRIVKYQEAIVVQRTMAVVGDLGYWK